MTQTGWTLGEFPWLGEDVKPAGCRVIIDNDFSGDPDDLFQVVHHVLSPSVEIRGIVASHLAPGDPFDPGPLTATHAADKLRELFAVMGLDADGLIWPGAESAMPARRTPMDSPAARAIVAEAMSDDPRPLFVACGGGLTEIASAWLIEPRIAERLTLIWIGGPEYPPVSAPFGASEPEYNLAIDVMAAQVVFNDSDLRLWQVPRNMYRQCLVSDIELRRRVATRGPLGRYLLRALRAVVPLMRRHGGGYPGTYALGDSPLVLLTALRSPFQSDTSSSDHVVLAAPELSNDGSYVPGSGGRPIRVYTRIDVRLMFEDMFGTLQAFAEWRGEA